MIFYLFYIIAVFAFEWETKGYELLPGQGNCRLLRVDLFSDKNVSIMLSSHAPTLIDIYMNNVIIKGLKECPNMPAIFMKKGSECSKNLIYQGYEFKVGDCIEIEWDKKCVGIKYRKPCQCGKTIEANIKKWQHIRSDTERGISPETILAEIDSILAEINQ